MYRLLAIDIDGTLVNSRGELTPDTGRGLATGQSGGHPRGAGHRAAL